MDPAGVMGDQVVEQAVFPVVATVTEVPVTAASAALAAEVENEKGEARVSTHVDLTVASTAKGAVGWLVPEMAAASLAVVEVASVSLVVIQQILRQEILAATYPVAVHHLMHPIT